MPVLPSAAMTQRHLHPGFTLIELILVMAIIGAMLAIVAPSLGRLRSQTRVADTAAQVRSMVELARARAVADGRPYRVVIDTADHECWIESLDAGGFARPTTSQGAKIALDESVAITSDAIDQPLDAFTLRAEPDGRAELVQLTLTGQDGRTLIVYARSITEPYRVGDADDAAVYAIGGVQ